MKIFKTVILLLTLNSANSDQDNLDLNEQIYIKLFQQKRAEQLNAIKSLLKLENNEKQRDLIHRIARQVFLVVEESRAKIEASDYIPGVSPFPSEDQTKNALSSILENAALFSEIVLRFPDLTESLLKTNNNWDVLLHWSIEFSNQVGYLLGNTTRKLLDLVSQELNYIERGFDYVNPYRKQKGRSNREVPVIQTPKRKKKEIKKGPRMTKTEL